MHRDPANILVSDLVLAAVQTSTHVDAEEPNGVADCERAAHRSCRSIEGCEEAVTARLHLMTVVSRQLSTNARAVPLQHLEPSLIAQGRRSLRGRYDIDEQDRRDDPARCWPPFERDVTVGLVLRPRFDATRAKRYRNVDGPQRHRPGTFGAEFDSFDLFRGDPAGVEFGLECGPVLGTQSVR